VKKGKILVVGGYGAVGRTIATTLGNSFPGQVIVAGRNYQKAEALSAELGQKVLPLALDVSNVSPNDKRLNDVALVVMCLDLDDPQFVAQCIQRGIHYIDISATYEILSKIEQLNTVAVNAGATVILSVGLMPGLSNLLAKHCQSKIPAMRYADIYVLLGMGEAHGEAAIRWTLENINTEFTLKTRDGTKRVSSFSKGKQTILPGGFGKRTAYAFDFSDQHVIPKTLNIDAAASWFCLDSAFVTTLFAWYKKTGLSKILKFESAQNFSVKLLQKFQFGSDKFIIKVEAGINPEQGALYECSVSGNGEACFTGLVAAKVAEALYTASFAPGVFHIEQLFDPITFIENIAGADLELEEHAL